MGFFKCIFTPNREKKVRVNQSNVMELVHPVELFNIINDNCCLYSIFFLNSFQ